MLLRVSASRLQNIPLVAGFRELTGNTRISVLFEIPFGIANTVYTFYLSLYMKGCGITDKQIGAIVAIGYFFGIVYSLFAGAIINRLGRKKSTMIFEILAYPLSCLLYFFAGNFWMFALARAVNSLNQISTVAWNFMVVEDADDRQRVAAFNILTLLHTAVGIITPIAGLIVARHGIVTSQKWFLLFSGVVLLTEMLCRNRFYTETRTGLELMRRQPQKFRFNPLEGLGLIVQNPSIRTAVCLNMLYNTIFPLSTHFSLYLNVYITDVLGIGEAAVSATGTFTSLGLIATCLFVIPHLNRRIRTSSGMSMALFGGFFIQIPYVLLMIFMPRQRLLFACLAVFIYAAGYALSKTYLDSLLACVTENAVASRGSIYSTMNALISLTSMLSGIAAGFLYDLEPASLFALSGVLLAVNLCVVALFLQKNNRARQA